MYVVLSIKSCERGVNLLCHLGRHSLSVGCSFLQIFWGSFRWVSDRLAPNPSPWPGWSWPGFGGASASAPSEFSSRVGRPGGQTSCGEQRQTWLPPPHQRLCEAFLGRSCPLSLCTSFFCTLNLPHFLNVNFFERVKNSMFVVFRKKNQVVTKLVVGQILQGDFFDWSCPEKF